METFAQLMVNLCHFFLTYELSPLKLILLLTQNRMNVERWNATIKWMQKTQNLWELGANQEVIVNYLVTNYPPVKKGRRMVLQDIDWYELED